MPSCLQAQQRDLARCWVDGSHDFSSLRVLPLSGRWLRPGDGPGDRHTGQDEALEAIGAAAFRNQLHHIGVEL